MSQINTHSRDWRLVRQWAEQQIAEDQRMIEQSGLSPEKTEFFRGRIAFARTLLELPTSQTARPTVPGDPGDA